MILIDPPDRNFGSDEQWLEFYEEMKQARADAIMDGNGDDDLQEIDDMIKLAEEMLQDRGLGLPI